MRVYQLNTFCGIKSTGRITTSIAAVLQNQNSSCKIGYGVEPVPEQWKSISYKVGSKFERKLHGAIRKYFDGEGYGSLFATKKLIKDIESFSPDIIHLHNIHGCYLNFSILFSYLKKINIPIVWTFHDCWAFTGHCAYFEGAECYKWLKLCKKCSQQYSYPINKGLDGSKRNYIHKKNLFLKLENLTIVTPSNWLSKYVKMSFFNKYRTEVIINGVDISVFYPRQINCNAVNSLLGKKKIVLSVASEWDERKGLEYLVKAYEILKNTHDFVIIGLTAEQVNSLPSGIIGIQHTQNVDELANYYSIADCFANPTLEDNMPMVNLEALACGTPIAVFNTGGCPEVVDEKTGIVVDKKDIKAFIKAIIILSEQKNNRSNDCQNKAKQLSDSISFAKYVSLYKELIK